MIGPCYNLASTTSTDRFILVKIYGEKNPKPDNKASVVLANGRNLNHANAITVPDNPTETLKAIVDVAMFASGCMKLPIPNGRVLIIAASDPSEAYVFLYVSQSFLLLYIFQVRD